MMKTKDNKILYSVITAIVIVVIFAFVFGLLFVKDKNNIYITLYSPIGNTKQVIKTSSGSEIDNMLEPVDVEGYEFIGWFYDDELTTKVEKGTVFNSSRILKAGYSKVINKSLTQDISYKDITNQKFLTIKTFDGVTLTKAELKTILQKGVRYLNLSNADLEKNVLDNEIFFGETTIKEVILPRNVVKIENYAFKNCYNLKYVKLGNQTTTLGNNAFYNCKNLETLDNLEVIQNLGQSVFEGCDSLKTLNLGKNLKTIEPKSFYGLQLNDIKIENENPNFRITGNVLYSYDYLNLIYVPSNYSGSLIINEQTQKVCDFALYGTKFLTSVTFPNSLSYIGDSAFKDCKNLEKVIFNSAKSYKISNYAFSGCEKIKQIQFATGLESIGKESFRDCKNIENIVFNISTATSVSNINYIGNGAFKNCKSLEYVIIPESVVFVGDELFYGCSNLEGIELSSKITEIPEKMFYENSALVKVETGNIKNINNYAFAECVKLTDIESLFTAENICVGAFKNCVNLKTVLFNNVKNIGDDCFVNCKSLTNVSFDNVVNFGENSFAYCESLKNFNIGNNVESIKDSTFYYCKNIENYNCLGNNYYVSIEGVLYDVDKKIIVAYPQNKKYVNFTINSTVEKILDKGLYLNQYLSNIDVADGNLYFSSVDGILFDYNKTTLLRYPCGKTQTEVVIDYDVEIIAEYAFAFNKHIQTLKIPSTVKVINNNALFGLTFIETIEVPFVGKTVSENKFIGYFFGANSFVSNHNYTPETLKNVIVTNDTMVAEYCFYDATSVEYIEFNKDVYIVEKYAFYGAKSLKEIYFNGAINSIKAKAIYNLPNLKTLTFGFDSLLVLDNNAIGELTYIIKVYIHNKNQNVPQDFRGFLISKFSSVYSKAGDWQWQFKNNVKNIL